MVLLEFGLKYRESKFFLLRILANLILLIEKKQADHFEKKLEQKQIQLPEDPEADAALFQKIMDQIQRDNES